MLGVHNVKFTMLKKFWIPIFLCVFVILTGCDEGKQMMKPVVTPEPTTEQPKTYTYIGFKPFYDTLAPVNPMLEWKSGELDIYQKNGFNLYAFNSNTRKWDISRWSDSITERSSKAFVGRFDRAILSKSSGTIVYDISGNSYENLDGFFSLSLIGQPSDAPCNHGGSVRFEIRIDSIIKYKTDTLIGSEMLEPIYFSIDIPNDASKLIITITDAEYSKGCDHWVIGDARLLHIEL